MNRPLDPRDSLHSSNLRDATPRLRMPAAPNAPRRMDMQAPAVRSRAPEPAPRYSQIEGRRMVVGKEITLSGQISKCDHLIVEGSMEGMRYDGQSLEVVEGGSFNGTIEVENAIIAGSFDGVITVRGQLMVRSSGRVSGEINYGEVEINAGGQINGKMEHIMPKAVNRAPIATVQTILSEMETENTEMLAPESEAQAVNE